MTADVPIARSGISVCPLSLYVPPGTWTEMTADVPTARSGISVCPLYVPGVTARKQNSALSCKRLASPLSPCSI